MPKLSLLTENPGQTLNSNETVKKDGFFVLNTNKMGMTKKSKQTRAMKNASMCTCSILMTYQMAEKKKWIVEVRTCCL